MENPTEALAKFKQTIPLFESLADENRQRIILLLGKNKSGLNVSQITEEAQLSRPAISHHLKVMKQVGLVDFTKQGKENIYTLTIHQGLEQLKQLISLIEANCSRENR